MMSTIIITMGAIVFLLLCQLHIERSRAERKLSELEAHWAAERRDLLDRIQAPSFEAYAGKVIREKRAEQPPEGKEEPIDFIS
ncbi:hypothetical protein GXP70_18145 [Paenibacillus lycopersici]|uniref:Uncharacterized protein n=1 Tax=Paenibacillus lycopersici TaxID=2704462 RepID=A0A6C0FX55_9BACL|nr:hypothetical protein [Paenibacillus lycopersici]QHT61706.1 hypothetical protein GXP70_18145 [Paenibacillus lycopersici]